MAVEKNPWAQDQWSLTDQIDYARKYGVERAAARARDAGTELGAKAPSSSTRRFMEASYVFTRVEETD